MKINKLKVSIVAGISAIIFSVMCIMGLVGINNDQEWRIRQSLTGEVTVIKDAGPYLRAFASVWDYPRALQTFFSSSDKEGGREDDSIRVTFNDGSTAMISSMLRWQTPVSDDERLEFHRDFGGSVENSEQAIRAFLINVMKNTAPLMSASEHQSARKSEFDQLVYEQLIDGTYETRKIQKELKDQFDEDGQPITVFATEIVKNQDGQPRISKPSPLAEYGIIIKQFSVTSTDYDQQTLKQFAAKKQSFLRAEQSKAEREEMVQERLMIEQRGLKEKAEVEAVALKEKAQATIQAQKEKEVAETEAAKKLSVAKLQKETAETAAQQKLSVAKLNRQAAEEEAEAIRLLASAEEEKIAKAGAITEKERVLAEIEAKKSVGIAKELANIKTPQVFFAGGSGEGGGDTLENLINIRLLESTGLLQGRNQIGPQVSALGNN